MRILIALLFLIASGFAQNTPYRWTISTRTDNAGSATVNWNIVDSTGNAVQSNIATVFPFNDDNAIKEVLDLLTLKAQRAAMNATSGSSMPAPMLDYSRIANRPSTFTPAAHTHLWGEITNPPATYAPSVHGQAAHDSSVTQNIAGGTATFATTAIAAGACSANATISATSGSLGNIGAADAVYAQSYKSAVGVADGRLIVNVQVAAGGITITRCNPTAASITPTALVLNWKVVR